ncbi:TPA: helix-turn-helix transcriptional regulator [Salmonella enterica subsp. enterica serovar Kentucky]|uniref:Helix-turn-helix transcriptional regulator n=2 Tax=Salmonella enterica I TaxID=59201 RepID=A0A3U0F3D5_SALET|nr:MULTISPECIES: helix-turn-helix transcriptional regulator [Enterobacteriaceae]EAN4171778.1 helix-turn-helix transcriptional regulator [Salmonella enterica]EDT2167696.1 helix-turn-helix transcriptional regulator [Salmonella enterica subsp. enterica]EEG0865136.1 helix-turn-helix transcriptional regulator [Salmonella enterica subsp. enterica serovar Litchfield]EGF4812672.1 helix-turn-helix transcriptional regulator [Escherichia coli]NAW09871.1 helix-turn-helix transcriptional regulator [Salmone
MNTLAERLKIAREKTGLSQAQLAESIGVSQQSVAKIENGDTLQPRKIKEIANVLGVSQKWLQLGIEENASLSDFVVGEAESASLDPAIFADIPVLDVELSAGNGCEAEIVESVIDWFPIRRMDLRKAGVSATNARIVKIWGNSLLPVLNNGDHVAVDIAQTNPIRDGDLYAVRDGVLLRVKVLINQPDGGLIIRSFNKDEYPDEILTFNERRARIHVIGRVFWSSRSW